MTDKGRFCKIHGEQVRYYCETEQKGVCTDCVGLKTCSHDHHRITIKEAAKKQASALEDAAKKCTSVKSKFQVVVDEAKTVKNQLTKSKEQAITELETLETKYFQEVRKVFKEQRDNITKVEVDKSKEVDDKLKVLEQGIDQIQTMCDQVSKICESKSEYLITHEYPTLSTTLDLLSQSQPEPCDADLGYLRFESVKTEVPLFCHVSVNKRWKLSRTFAAKGLTKPEGITIDVDDNVAVSCWEKGIKSYSNKDQFISTVYDSYGAVDIAITSDNRCIIAPFNQIFIQCNDMRGNKLFSTPVTDVNNKPSKANSVAVDLKGRIIVGQTDNTISIHHADGSVISKFATKFMPYRLATASNGEIISSFYDRTLKRGISVALMDYSGHNVRVIQPPALVKAWSPSYVCCRQGEIFIVNTNAGDPAGVYRYTAEGDYLGCVTTEVNDPGGIALSKDGMKLYLVERDVCLVKIFTRY